MVVGTKIFFSNIFFIELWICAAKQHVGFFLFSDIFFFSYFASYKSMYLVFSLLYLNVFRLRKSGQLISLIFFGLALFAPKIKYIAAFSIFLVKIVERNEKFTFSGFRQREWTLFFFCWHTWVRLLVKYFLCYLLVNIVYLFMFIWTGCILLFHLMISNIQVSISDLLF